MAPRKTLFSLFLLSITLIAFQLFVIKTFSVGNWSNFGSFVISTALLGFGVSGTLLTLIKKRVEKNAELWLYTTSLLFLITLTASHILGQQVPFNPIFIGSHSNQILWIGIYYLIYGIPFFFCSLFIGVSFVALSNRIHHLYFWNMLGSGLGGFLFILILYLFPPQSLIVPIIILAAFSNIAIMALHDPVTERLSFPLSRFLVTAGVLVLCLFGTYLWGNIRVSEYKAINYVRKYPDAQEVHHSYTPAGEMHVYASSYFHFAPGLSDNAIFALEQMPSQPFWGLYIDGNGPIGIMGKVEKEHAVYMDYLPMAAPYSILDKPKNLLVNLGGGINAQVAAYKGSEEITIYEQNPVIVSLLRDDPIVSRFTGNLLEDPRIDVRVGDARSHCVEHPATYDLVEISLIDSIGLSDSGGYAIAENYTYTSEAVEEYMTGLTEEGVLSVTVWNRLSPPRNVLKLLSTAVDSLRRQGVENPEDRIFMFDLFLSTATILIKNSDYTSAEIEELKQFCASRSFDVLYYPGIPKRDKDLSAILATVRNHFSSDTELEENLSFTSGDIYHLMLLEMLQGDAKDLYKEYAFDIRPMRDSRPYYSGFLKLNEIGMYLDQIQDVSEEWAFVLNIGIVVQSLFFGFLIILIPVIGKWKSLFKRQRGTLGVIVYYSCLGLGYMLVEIFFIQRLVFFLSNPIFATSIVITSMLIISGVGNIVSRRIARDRAWRVRIAVIGIVVSMLFYMFLLGPFLDMFRENGMVIRVLLTVIVIAPGAFFLGMPFPNGLSSLTEHKNDLIPWAWGMNGALSVTGAALANLISVSMGFPVLLAFVCALYIIVGLIFPANRKDFAKYSV